MFEPVTGIAIVVILIVAGLLASAAGGRRRALTAVAGRLAARYSARDPVSVPELLGDLYFMQKGHSTRAFNVIRGRLGRCRFMAFDYRYELGCGGDRAVVKGGFVICQGQVQLPSAVALVGEPFDSIGGYRHFSAVAWDDSRCDGTLSLYTDQPNRLRDLLSGPAGEILLQCNGVDWQLRGNQVVFHTRGGLTPGQILRLIHRGARCCRRLEAGQVT